MAFQCGHLEAQDVLADSDDVDLICLDAEPGFPRKVRWLRRLMYHDVTRRLAFANPGIKPVKLERDYDLIVVMCQGYWEFLYINAIAGWKDHCRTSVCWIDELYAADVPRCRYWLPSLARFDHVVVGMHGTVGAMGEAVGRPCHYVPGGVDCLRFSPYPDPPPRVIDVYSIGRRLEGVHQTLLKMAARDSLFYLHDTLQSSGSQASDHREHRDLYANIAKRSRFFMVAPGKVNVPEETQGQSEVGFRYYEGAAAGTVLVGRPPDSPAFREMFDWPQSVVSVNADGSDLDAVLSQLSRRPEQIEMIGRRNVAGALRRHDWIYRWQRILEIAGLAPGPGMHARVHTLQTLADEVARLSR
jgi:hypothetical protein